MNKPQCPICGTPSNLVRDLPSDFLRDALGEYYLERMPDGVNIGSYQLLRCPRCDAGFCEPMTPGDATFYSWIAPKAGYYPQSRWEWGEVTNEIKKRGVRPASLLEVGCGSGSFLEGVLGDPAVRAVGLDTEAGSIAKCTEKGCEAYCEDISAFLSRNPGRQFDFVVAFHCLEHVAEPMVFLRAMLSALKPGGSIFVSTPYSPMSFETGWFDPLNHPPHHMTRWNARAYQEAATQLGLDVRLRMPKAFNPLRRAKDAIILRKFGTRGAPSKLGILWALFGNPMLLLSEIRKQRSRERLGGFCAADVVLAEFRNATNSVRALG